MLYLWPFLTGCIAALPHHENNLQQRALQQRALVPVLAALSQEPDLTEFYGLFNSTGGSSGIPSPGFEERFDNPSTGLSYTVFAPTNEALRRLSPAFIDNLKRASSFELLATILRNHIALGRFTAADLSATEPIRLVGGFSIIFNSSGRAEINPGVTKSEVPSAKKVNLIKNESGQPIMLNASDGVVYKIDNVFDLLDTYYGIDAPGDSDALPEPTKVSGTMADILKSDPELSDLKTVFEALEPDFIDRLALFSHEPDAGDKMVYLAPGKTAFDALPDSAAEKAVQPSNYGASRFLLMHGYGEYDESTSMVRSANGFNISIKQGRANNAKIEKGVCAENGCVWVVRRWIDPTW